MIGATPHTNYTHHWHHLFFLFLILFFHLFPLLPLQAYDWAHHLPWGALAVPWTWTDVPSSTSCQLHHSLLELQKTAWYSVTAHPIPGCRVHSAHLFSHLQQGLVAALPPGPVHGGFFLQLLDLLSHLGDVTGRGNGQGTSCLHLCPQGEAAVPWQQARKYRTQPVLPGPPEDLSS